MRSLVVMQIDRGTDVETQQTLTGDQYGAVDNFIRSHTSYQTYPSECTANDHILRTTIDTTPIKVVLGARSKSCRQI